MTTALHRFSQHGRRIPWLVFVVLTLLGITPAQAFQVEEATIAGVHAAMLAGELTCVELTSVYLKRIAAYESQDRA